MRRGSGGCGGEEGVGGGGKWGVSIHTGPTAADGCETAPAEPLILSCYPLCPPFSGLTRYGPRPPPPPSITPSLHHSPSLWCIRFDFNLTRPMTPTEVAEVEALVNGWVAAATPLQVRVRRGMYGGGRPL